MVSFRVFTIRRTGYIFDIGRRGWAYGACSFVTPIPDIYWPNRKFNGRFPRATPTESTRALRARLRVAMCHRFYGVNYRMGDYWKYFSFSALETLKIVAAAECIPLREVNCDLCLAIRQLFSGLCFRFYVSVLFSVLILVIFELPFQINSFNFTRFE